LFLCDAFTDLVLLVKGDSTKHVEEAAIVAVGLATAEVVSSMDKVVPEDVHESTPETEDSSVEKGTTESQREHEVDVTAPDPDIDSSHRNEPTPVPLPLEPIKTESAAEPQVETTATATTKSVATDMEDQPDSGSNETALNAGKEIEEVQAQVDDTSNIKGEPIPESDVIQHIEAGDSELEVSLEDVPSPSTKESQNTVQLEPEADFVAPAEEEPSAITEEAAEHLSPNIESEEAISRASGEIIPISEDTTAPVANVEDQIIVPVDVRPEQVSSTDKPAEVIVPANVEERLETLKPLVAPSYKDSDDGIVEVSFFPNSMHLSSLN
jgi:hypothetical protein